MKPMDNEQLVAVLHIGLRILSLRLLTLTGLMLDAGLFGWAMWAGGYDRLAIAATFAILTGALIHFRRE